MKKNYLLCITYFIFIAMNDISACSNFKTLFEKEIYQKMNIRFIYEYNEEQSIHKWQTFLCRGSDEDKLLLDTFSYAEDQLPIRLTPDIWQETIYQLFSCLDAISLDTMNNRILVLYDMFGDIHFKNYKIDTINNLIDKERYPIQKYNMSFLLGYNSGYGKILRDENNIYAYYSAAAPPRQNLIKLSLKWRELTQINIKKKKKKEKSPAIIQAIHQDDLNTISLHLSKLLNESVNIFGAIKDISANRPNSTAGLIYYFAKQNKKTLIVGYDIFENKWLTGNYTEEEIQSDIK